MHVLLGIVQLLSPLTLLLLSCNLASPVDIFGPCRSLSRLSSLALYFEICLYDVHSFACLGLGSPLSGSLAPATPLILYSILLTLYV
ncbi:hypothetical protein EDB84DRAFT_914122 [Lactarius hengduanensis]|nr:hypothetical protein EDB84DRAFT_914122 [Lactarius hengduanensis]